MAVEVTLMIASRGLRICGSGTSSMRSRVVPCQQLAFMSDPLPRFPAFGYPPTEPAAAARRLSPRGGDLTGLQELLESAQVLPQTRAWIGADETRDAPPGCPAQRRVPEQRADQRAPIPRGRVKANHPGVGQVRAPYRMPGDAPCGLIGGRLDGHGRLLAERTAQHPPYVAIIDLRNRLHGCAESRQIVDVAPELVALLGRLVDDQPLGEGAGRYCPAAAV